MSGSIFNRLKTWITKEDVNAADLNAEFDNILDNLDAAGAGGYSNTVTEMRIQEDPGNQGTESLAVSLAEELTRLRFQIAQLQGTTYWYDDPVATLAGLNSSLAVAALPATRLVSGQTTGNSNQSVLLTPQGSGNGDDLTINATATDLVYRVDDIEYTVDTDVVISSTNSPPVTNNTAIINEAAYSDQEWTRYVGMHNTGMPIDTIGSEITSLNGKLAAFKLTTGAGSEYFLAIPDTTNNQLKSCYRGFFFDESNTAVPSIVFADDDTITLMEMVWVFINTAGASLVTYNEPIVASTAPAIASSGDVWFDLTVNKWKQFDGAVWNDTNAAFVGIGIIDENGDCVAARSADFGQSVSDINTIRTEVHTNTTVTSNKDCRIAINGTIIDFYTDEITWDITSDLDTGSETNDTMYFLYLKEDGTPVISITAPDDFIKNRGGLYHPQEMWRAVGQFWNNASGHISKLISYHTDDLGVAEAESTVDTNALTLQYWSSPLATYNFYEEESTTASGANSSKFPFYQSITVPAGAELDHLGSASTGTPLATSDNVILHLVKKTNVIVLGVSSHQWGQRDLVSTTALDATSDGSLLYSLSSYTDAQVRAVAYGRSTQTTAGTWANNLANFGAFRQLNVCRSKKLAGLTRTTTSTSFSSAGSTTFRVTGERRIRVFLSSDNNTSTGVAAFEIFNAASTLATGYIALYDAATRLRTYRARIEIGGASSVKSDQHLNHIWTLDPAEISVGESSFDIQVASDGSATIALDDGMLVIEELPYDEVDL